MKKNAIIVTIIVVTSIVITNGVQFFIVSKLNGKSEAKYKSQIEQLNATINAIGPLIDCWTVSDKIKTVGAGTVVLESDLEEIKIPESCVHDNFIADKYDVLGKFYKINLGTGTPFTKDMFMDKELDNTSRELDITADVFPIGLKVGDYIDFRLLYPKGEDYIVLPHLRINQINGETIKVILNEKEILFYDSASVENYMNTAKGSMTYLAKYTEPGVQEPAKATYSVPQAIMNLLDKNPNLAAKIENGSVNRDVIDSATQGLSPETSGLLQAGKSSIVGKIKAARDLYDNNQTTEKQKVAADAAQGDVPVFGATNANGQSVDLTKGDKIDVTSATQTAKDAVTKATTGGVE